MMRIIATRGAEELVGDAPPERLRELLDEPQTFVWLNLSPPATEAEGVVLREVFKFHPLSIEDCFETRTEPKIDEFDSYLYVITHGVLAGSNARSVTAVELDFFLGPRYLVTHQSQPSRSIAAVTDIVLRSGLPLRRGPVGVMHAVIDRQVDGLEQVLEDVEQVITALEAEVFERPANARVATALNLKRSILKLRRWMWKQRDVLLRLGRGEFAQIAAGDALLFRDVYDHHVRMNDLVESFREMLTSIQEAHLSVTSNRLNEIMKVLTVFTVVLMPPTLLAGIYGMNFQHMPELARPWGYPVALGAMAAIAGGVLWYFKRRGWLGKPPDEPGR
jgi:magnesium transporter